VVVLNQRGKKQKRIIRGKKKLGSKRYTLCLGMNLTESSYKGKRMNGTSGYGEGSDLGGRQKPEHWLGELIKGPSIHPDYTLSRERQGRTLGCNWGSGAIAR